MLFFGATQQSAGLASPLLFEDLGPGVGTMEEHEILSDFDKGQIFMARQLGQNPAETAKLVGCSVSAVQDLLDLEKKLTKLTAKKDKLEKQVEKLEEKMKKKVQERDTEKLRQSQTELQKVQEEIEKLI